MNQIGDDDNALGEDILACAAMVAETIDGDEYSEVTEALAVQFAERGELNRAVELAETIPDPYLKDRTLGVVAAFGIGAGLPDYATDLLETIEDPMLRELAIEQIAIKYAQQGKFEESIHIASELVDSAPVVGNIAVIQAIRGMPAEALDLVRSIETLPFEPPLWDSWHPRRLVAAGQVRQLNCWQRPPRQWTNSSSRRTVYLCTRQHCLRL